MARHAKRLQGDETGEGVLPDVAAEINRLTGLKLAALRSAWTAEFRKPVPKGLSRDLLLRTLAWRLQEKAYGGHDRETLKLLEVYGRRKAEDQLYKRLKSGTVLVREFEGTRHTVTIVRAGFVWQEKTYSSLSAIACLITGTKWNGPRFFGLREGQARAPEAQEHAA